MCNLPSWKWLRYTGYATAFVASLSLAGTACAESTRDFPSHSMRLISGFAPGGVTDLVARLVAKQMTVILGQPVVVENKPGAAGNIAAAYVAHSKPDGYTMYLTNATIAMPSLFSKLPFDVRKDFALTSLIGLGPSVLVASRKSGIKSVREFIDAAKKKSGTMDYGSGGVGNITQMEMELFISMTGIKLTHIPYKGGGPSTLAVITGEVPVAFVAASDAISHIKHGDLVALAVSTRHRISALPNVPTVAEAGVPGYDAASWYGILLPAGTSEPIVKKLTSSIVKSLHTKSVRDTLIVQGVQPSEGGTKEFTSYMKSQIDTWAKIIARAHISVR